MTADPNHPKATHTPSTRILGIEGTAWAASAAIYDVETDEYVMESAAYRPESGGIHPREAAEHMQESIPAVVEAALERRGELGGDRPADAKPVDAVAFSRGPGLGPCLRIAGTAARATALRLAVPVVGVNHMVAHLEVGRHRAGFDSPVCLNASGANAHVLGFHDGRYRVLGETMDTGVGNALDKFTRHVGWSHPGGPKVEAAAKDGEYVDLPYVVKGMDFSFSGIMSAAKDAYDDGAPVEDVCCGLQESVFGMLTEVAERALSLTGSDELVLGGGVGQNDRLREMLGAMCDQRGARFFAPPAELLRDNAAMIAITGAKMYAAGATVDVADSAVDSNFRPDEVPVTWRSGEDVARTPRTDEREVIGAEATVTIGDETVVKARNPREYRHPALDARLRRERTTLEARLTGEARLAGVPTPTVLDVDPETATLTFQRVGDRDLGAALSAEHVAAVGRHLARLHGAGIVHGDPTTRNVRVADGSDAEPAVFLIDFGLGFHSRDVEDYAMDVHVFEQSLDGTAEDPTALREAVEAAYREAGDPAVIDRLRAIEGRGRYQ